MLCYVTHAVLRDPCCAAQRPAIVPRLDLQASNLTAKTAANDNELPSNRMRQQSVGRSREQGGSKKFMEEAKAEADARRAAQTHREMAEATARHGIANLQLIQLLVVGVTA